MHFPEAKRRAVENLVKAVAPSAESVTNEKGKVSALHLVSDSIGGADEDRTPDLTIVNEAPSFRVSEPCLFHRPRRATSVFEEGRETGAWYYHRGMALAGVRNDCAGDSSSVVTWGWLKRR